MRNICKNNTVLLILAAVWMVFSCNRVDYSSKYYMTLDTISYVTKFPNTYKLENSLDVGTDVIGYHNFKIFDSLLIFATNDNEGFWSFVSLADKRTLGQFLRRGQGPNEFLFSPSLQTRANFFSDNGKQYIAIYDCQRGKVYKMDIDESLKTGKLSMSTMKESAPRFLFNFVRLDADRFLCRTLDSTRTQQPRYIMNSQQNESNPVLEKLNRAKVHVCLNPAYYFNIISAIIKYNQERDLVVEVPTMLNYLNLYSIDGSFEKTICIGKKLNSIEKIETLHLPDLVTTFYDLRLYDNFLGVVFVNETEMALQVTGRTKFPSIFLFDWEGNPLAELKLDRHLTSFDIDFSTGFLYGLDKISEEFFRYDIRHILRKIHSTY